MEREKLNKNIEINYLTKKNANAKVIKELFTNIKKKCKSYKK